MINEHITKLTIDIHLYTLINRLLGKATIALRNVVHAAPGTPLDYDLGLLDASDTPTVGTLKLLVSYKPPGNYLADGSQWRDIRKENIGCFMLVYVIVFDVSSLQLYYILGFNGPLVPQSLDPFHFFNCLYPPCIHFRACCPTSISSNRFRMS